MPLTVACKHASALATLACTLVKARVTCLLTLAGMASMHQVAKRHWLPLFVLSRLCELVKHCFENQPSPLWQQSQIQGSTKAASKLPLPATQSTSHKSQNPIKTSQAPQKPLRSPTESTTTPEQHCKETDRLDPSLTALHVSNTWNLPNISGVILQRIVAVHHVVRTKCLAL